MKEVFIEARVEQPVGTGFSIGIVTASGVDAQQEIAQDFINFFKNWQDLFGIKNYKIFVTGESYAGRYVPYISAAMLDANNTEYYDLQGKYNTFTISTILAASLIDSKSRSSGIRSMHWSVSYLVLDYLLCSHNF